MSIASLAWGLTDSYNHLMVNYKDSRVDSFYLMSSPLPTLLICAGYIYFVKYLGPRLMRDRPPFELKNVIIVYNIIQIVFSTYLVYKFLVHGWLWRYSWTCQPVNFSYDHDELVMVQLCSWYFYCKFFEFLDTVFFVLRKKMDQVTVLHIIHHTIMPAFSWLGLRFLPTGHGTFFLPVNSFVHVIMYSYYLLSAMGPKYQKYIWWKKHLTTIQMIQFVSVFIHTIQLFFNGCDYPLIIAYILCMNATLFMALFSNFYIQAYIKRRRLPQVKKENCEEEETASKIESAKIVFKKTIMGIFNCLSFSANRDLQEIPKMHAMKNKTC